MINESYLTFIEICKKPGVYVDKKANLVIKIKGNKAYTKSRNGKWEEKYSPVNMVNKARFLKYSEKQARGV